MPKNNRSESIAWMLTFTFLVMLVILLLYNIGLYMVVRHEISKYNRDVIRDCLLLECTITPFGDVRCDTPTLASELKENGTWLMPTWNMTGGG